MFFKKNKPDPKAEESTLASFSGSSLFAPGLNPKPNRLRETSQPTPSNYISVNENASADIHHPLPPAWDTDPQAPSAYKMPAFPEPPAQVQRAGMPEDFPESAFSPTEQTSDSTDLPSSWFSETPESSTVAALPAPYINPDFETAPQDHFSNYQQPSQLQHPSADSDEKPDWDSFLNTFSGEETSQEFSLSGIQQETPTWPSAEQPTFTTSTPAADTSGFYDNAGTEEGPTLADLYNLPTAPITDAFAAATSSANAPSNPSTPEPIHTPDNSDYGISWGMDQTPPPTSDAAISWGVSEAPLSPPDSSQTEISHSFYEDHGSEDKGQTLSELYHSPVPEPAGHTPSSADYGVSWGNSNPLQPDVTDAYGTEDFPTIGLPAANSDEAFTSWYHTSESDVSPEPIDTFATSTNAPSESERSPIYWPDENMDDGVTELGASTQEFSTTQGFEELPLPGDDDSIVLRDFSLSETWAPNQFSSHATFPASAPGDDLVWTPAPESDTAPIAGGLSWYDDETGKSDDSNDLADWTMPPGTSSDSQLVAGPGLLSEQESAWVFPQSPEPAPSQEALHTPSLDSTPSFATLDSKASDTEASASPLEGVSPEASAWADMVQDIPLNDPTPAYIEPTDLDSLEPPPLFPQPDVNQWAATPDINISAPAPSPLEQEFQLGDMTHPGDNLSTNDTYSALYPSGVPAAAEPDLSSTFSFADFLSNETPAEPAPSFTPASFIQIDEPVVSDVALEWGTLPAPDGLVQAPTQASESFYNFPPVEPLQEEPAEELPEIPQLSGWIDTEASERVSMEAFGTNATASSETSFWDIPESSETVQQPQILGAPPTLFGQSQIAPAASQTVKPELAIVPPPPLPDVVNTAQTHFAPKLGKLDILGVCPLATDKRLLVVNNGEVFALMAQDGLEDNSQVTVLKLFDRNPLAFQSSFSAVPDLRPGREGLYVVQIGNQRGQVSVTSHQISWYGDVE